MNSFWGGDYKFILIMLGLKGATSFYACAWCKVHKDKRWDMNHEEDFYNKPPLQRTLKELKELSKKGRENFCCEHEPLLNIELDHVILDELHLLLRVVDVLLNNLLEDVLQWDKKDDLNKKRGEKKGVHRERLQAAVRSCGVSFDIWEKTNADGKGSGTYDFTSLLGNDKKQLLRELPGKILSVVQTSTSNTVKKIWEDFRELYTFIGSGQNSDKQITVFFEKAKS